MKRVLLAGEGPNDLGSHGYAGVLEALLRLVQPQGWEVVGAIPWRKIPKYRAGERRRPEERNVIGLLLEARKRRVDAVVFVRDRDGYERREEDFERALQDAALEFDDIEHAGGVAIERLESWLLALKGEAKTERRSNQQIDARLGALNVSSKSTAAMVEHCMSCSIDMIPADAKSLLVWIDRARRVLAPFHPDGTRPRSEEIR